MPPLLTSEELIEKLAARSIHEANGCLRWDGYVRPDGYVTLRWHRKTYQAHRLAYELLRGPIPEGMALDHLCHTRDQTCTGGPCLHRSCLNVEHLEVVTGPENSHRMYKARRTHCNYGHPFTEANIYRNPAGIRCCRTCKRIFSAARRQRLRAAA